MTRKAEASSAQAAATKVLAWSYGRSSVWRNLAALTRLKEVAATPVAAFVDEAKNISDRGDRLGLVVASAAVAGVVVMAVLYTLMSERLKPTPKPSVETSQQIQAPPPPGNKK
jgi:hypothetical protein